MTSPLSSSLVEKIRSHVNPQRLVDTALALIEIPSPTRSAGAVADRLAALLEQDGLTVERPIANWPTTPAIVVRLSSRKYGREQLEKHHKNRLL